MFEGLHYIELAGKKYPVKCDLLVLEKLQEEFGSISEFEEGLITWEPELDEKGEPVLDEEGEPKYKGKIPVMKAVNAALEYMVNEGEAIAAEQEGREPVFVKREEIVRKVDLSPQQLANQLHDEFYRCFRIKNGKTTQNVKKKEMTKQILRGLFLSE